MSCRSKGRVLPGQEENAHWREHFGRRIVAVWDKGGDVWIAKRLLAETPRPEWTWVEGDDKYLSWRDYPRSSGRWKPMTTSAAKTGSCA